MNLTVSDENVLFFKQIWMILGIESILKSELIYKISYKMNLPYKPTTLVKKIRDAITDGILTEKDKFLYLNKKDMDKIKKEKKTYDETQKKRNQKQWNRIEESIDPWMSVVEEKTKKKDLKSLSLNAIVRSIMPEEETEKGKKIPGKNFHYQLEKEILSGTIEDETEENIMFQIDLGKKTLIHNCSDFVQNLSEKVLCKHFYRIFMYVKIKDPVFSKNMLLSLYSKKDEWEFKKT